MEIECGSAPKVNTACGHLACSSSPASGRGACALFTRVMTVESEPLVCSDSTGASSCPLWVALFPFITQRMHVIETGLNRGRKPIHGLKPDPKVSIDWEISNGNFQWEFLHLGVWDARNSRCRTRKRSVFTLSFSGWTTDWPLSEIGKRQPLVCHWERFHVAVKLNPLTHQIT